MTIIQATRRKKEYAINIIALAANLVFLPNEKGDVVCKVDREDVKDWLFLNPESFRVYGEQEAPKLSPLLTAPLATLPPLGAPLPPSGDPLLPAGEGSVSNETLKTPQGETLPTVGHAHVLKNGDTEFDLRPLSDAELREFAKANEIKLTKGDKGDVIRDKIVKALTAEG